MDPNKRKEDSFFEKLTGLLDAGPEQSTLPATKKRRVEDIVSEVCEESGKHQSRCDSHASTIMDHCAVLCLFVALTFLGDALRYLQVRNRRRRSLSARGYTKITSSD